MWLGPYVELLEEALRHPIRAVVAAPPQHGKTVTTTHALVRAFRVKPGGRSAYATYNAKRSARVERTARVVAERDGLDVQFRQDDWFNPKTNGSVIWASRSGGLTGDPVDTLLVVDDILKDRQEANSALVRQECIDWFDDVAEPRCHPTASIIVMATRWHPDDLSGLLIKRGWKYINLKALADGETDAEGRVVADPLRRFPGEPLCAERQPKDALEQKRKTNIYSFASLYQGEPRPRGGTLFSDPNTYTQEPAEFVAGYGIDLAYTAKTSADYSVCIEGWFTNQSGEDGRPNPKLYIVDVQRKQVEAKSFILTLAAKTSARRGPMLWYVGGTEKTIAEFIRARVKSLAWRPATVDKFQRAQPASEAWNDGRILIPGRPILADGTPDDEWQEPEWLAVFLDEVMNFTGVNDAHDDQVDALSALWDLFTKFAPKRQRDPMSGSLPAL